MVDEFLGLVGFLPNRRCSSDKVVVGMRGALGGCCSWVTFRLIHKCVAQVKCVKREKFAQTAIC